MTDLALTTSFMARCSLFFPKAVKGSSMRSLKIPKYTEEEALGRIISYLRGKRPESLSLDPAGASYDLYIPYIIHQCLKEQQDEQRRQNPNTGMVSWELDLQANSEPFYDAAWALCTRGVLRPGIVQPREQFQFAPIIGAGFLLTPYGQEWLSQISGYEAIPSEYGRFSTLLAAYSPRFGAGYHVRSQETVRCYRAHTYLACCVMCGAAAESVLLALAIAKTGDETRVLNDYRTNTGRSKIERLLLSHANSYVQQELPNFTNLLKYWRDAAAHGANTSINEGEAFTSLILLLRFAQFADDQWQDLTGQSF
jgi:hypothetical protein